MKDKIIADAESDNSRFLASFISDEFRVVCCNNSGKTLDDRITTRTFEAFSTIQPYCRLRLTYDSGFLTTVMNNKDIKQFVLDNMSEVKSHIGSERLKERLTNNNIKYI